MCHAFAIQPDGKIVVAGRFYGLGDRVNSLVGRVSANGVVEESLTQEQAGSQLSLLCNLTEKF